MLRGYPRTAVISVVGMIAIAVSLILQARTVPRRPPDLDLPKDSIDRSRLPVCDIFDVADAQPAEPPVPEQAQGRDVVTPPVPDGAVRAAFEVIRRDEGGPTLDERATMALLHQRVDIRQDLNGDGNEEIIFDVGCHVLRDGTPMSRNGATGNRAWAIVTDQGGWRSILDGHTGWVQVLDSSHHGWRDLVEWEHLGGGNSGVSLILFDGHTYRREWSTFIDGDLCEDDSSHVSECYVPLPKDLCESILARSLSRKPTQWRVLEGGALAGDCDADGRQELFLQLNKVECDGIRFRPAPNLFVYTRRNGRWVPIMECRNMAEMPVPYNSTLRRPFSFSVQTGGTWRKPQRRMYWIRSGRIVPGVEAKGPG
jgi:hypothetical protein